MQLCNDLRFRDCAHRQNQNIARPAASGVLQAVRNVKKSCSKPLRNVELDSTFCKIVATSFATILNIDRVCHKLQ